MQKSTTQNGFICFVSSACWKCLLTLFKIRLRNVHPLRKGELNVKYYPLLKKLTARKLKIIEPPFSARFHMTIPSPGRYGEVRSMWRSFKFAFTLACGSFGPDAKRSVGLCPGLWTASGTILRKQNSEFLHKHTHTRSCSSTLIPMCLICVKSLLSLPLALFCCCFYYCFPGLPVLRQYCFYLRLTSTLSVTGRPSSPLCAFVVLFGWSRFVQ